MSDAKPLIAVTGGTGFVGQHMIKALLEQGYFVRALARTPSKLSHITHQNLEILKGSLGQHDAMLVKGADVLLHMAGLIKAKTRQDIMAVNRDAAGTIAKAAQNASVPRLGFTILTNGWAATAFRLCSV